MLDAIVVSRLDPWDLLGLELHFLDAVAAGACLPVLIVYGLAGRVVSIGRYHLYGGPEHRGGIGAYRRLTGGRVWGAGEGWLGVAFVLPTRSSLLEERDAALKPDQVMNRYVRGVLGALRKIGLDCFYPGRDAVTINRRQIAMSSFETDAAGAMLVDLVLAVNRGLEDLVHDLERFDPDGAIGCPMYDRDNSTTVARELGRHLTIEKLADAIAPGYAESLGQVEVRELTTPERSDGERRGAALRSAGWLNDSVPDASLDKVARASSQLGFVEARLKLRDDGTIDRIKVAGDFLANSPGLAQFESELSGMRLDLATVSSAAMRVFGAGSNYILGMGELADLVRLIMKAA